MLFERLRHLLLILQDLDVPLMLLFQRRGGFREQLQRLQVILHTAPRVVALGRILQL